MTAKRAFVGITGASGTIYALRIIEALQNASIEIHTSITKGGLLNAETEFGEKYASYKEFFNKQGLKNVVAYDEEDKSANPASGSFPMDYYIFVPASMGFVGRIAAGVSLNLPERAADVAMKERRRLIILFREMPLSSIHLENLLKLSNNGAVILPAAPAFYNKPSTIDDLINFTVGKILDILRINNNLYDRWNR